MKICSLLFLLRDDEILLAMKKRGFGSGRWNGVGGKAEPGETMEQTTIRECQEEIGVTPRNLEKVALHMFVFPNDIADIEVHTYFCREWEGEPTETGEMAPRWFRLKEIPYTDMWHDDIYWLPSVLNGQKLRTQFTFDGDEQLLRAKIELVDQLDVK